MEKKYEDRLLMEISVRGLSEATKKAYLSSVRRFTRFHTKPTDELDSDDAKQFMLHLSAVKKLAPRSVNQMRGGIVFFLRHVMKKPIYPGLIPQMKAPKVLPHTLTKDEVRLMIDSLDNVFYKAVITTLYSTGLRNAEIRGLKIGDIDSKAMVIHVRQGKGDKDRKALLSPIALKYLRAYWSKYRQNNIVKSDWLFIPTKNCKDGRLAKQLSHTALGYIVSTASKAAGIKKKYIPIY